MAMAEKPVASYLWRRLEQPGHDFCRLIERDDGWQLSGTAVFMEHGPCRLDYRIVTDRQWRTRSARVIGYVHRRAVDLAIRVARGRWSVNGVARPRIVDSIDVDLNFTPATNQIAIRRLGLGRGQAAAAPAAWLEFPQLRLVGLPQYYRRIDAQRYDYRAPTVGYAGLLVVDRDGSIAHYPELFEKVARR